MTTNKTVIKWLDEMKQLLTPDNVVWIDGSDEQREALREEAVKLGELTKLNQDKLPGCYLHRTVPNDVARVEDRTFICSKKRMQVLQITGVTLKKCTKSFTTLLAAAIRAEQCISFLILWDLSVLL